MKYHARDYLAVLGSHAALPLAQIFHACRLSVLITHWELTLLVLAFAAVYSFTRYDGVQKLFAALRVEVFFLLLFGLLVFPFFGMDALTVWESVREGISNGVHALLGILYA